MTGLRGVAALLVAIYHFHPSGAVQPPALDRFVGKGYLWVDLFFILSGFLIALNYAHLFDGQWSPGAWGDFLLRRLGRVYPLYFTLTLLSLGYTLVAHGGLGVANPAPAIATSHPLRDLAANVLMVQSWGVGRSFVGPAWSISTEWAAYILFPLLVGAALFGRPYVALAAMLGAMAIVVATAMLALHDGAFHRGPLDAYDGATAQPLLRCLGGFTLGLLIYRAASWPALGWLATDPALLAVLALLAVGLASGTHDLMLYPLFAMLVFGLYGNRGMVGRLFGCRPVYWLGVVSYSVYLLHIYLIGPRYVLADWLRPRLPAPWAAGATDLAICATLLLLATLAYHAVEAPGRRWMRALTSGWASASARYRPGVGTTTSL